MLAVTDAGKGRTLALTTDTSWHWGFLAAGAGDDGRTFQRFWESAIRWLVRDPALTLLRVELDRVEYRRGPARLGPRPHPARRLLPRRRDAGGAVALPDRGRRRRPSRCARSRWSPTRRARPTWSCPALAAGVYRLVGAGHHRRAHLTEEQTFVIRPEGRELEDVVSQKDVLREIASITGGAFIEGAIGYASRAQAARDPRRQPAHGGAVVQPAAAPAGHRACWPPSGRCAAAPATAERAARRALQRSAIPSGPVE